MNQIYFPLGYEGLKQDARRFLIHNFEVNSDKFRRKKEGKQDKSKCNDYTLVVQTTVH